MGNSQQSPRSTTPSEQHVISLETDEERDHTRSVTMSAHRRSVDGRVMTPLISGAAIQPRRSSWSPRSIDRSALDHNRRFNGDDFAVRQSSSLSLRLLSTGSTYIDRLLSPTPLLREVYQQRPSCRDATQTASFGEDLTDGGRAVAAISSQLDECWPTPPSETSTCYDVTQHDVADATLVEEVQSARHSEDEDQHSSTDDNSDVDYDDDDTASVSTADGSLSDDISSTESEDISDRDNSTVAQGTSVASQTSLKLFELGYCLVLYDVATQTGPECLPADADRHQPYQQQGRCESDKPAGHDTWYSENSCEEEQASDKMTRHKHDVDRSGCDIVREALQGHDSAPLSPEQDLTSICEDQQQNGGSKTDDEATMTVSDETELLGNKSERRRQRVDASNGDVSERHRGTGLRRESSSVSHEPATSRNGCTWHTDVDRNSRIWKLLVKLF